MDLIINPKPDTLIRINMEFKPLLFPIDVELQKLEKELQASLKELGL